MGHSEVVGMSTAQGKHLLLISRKIDQPDRPPDRVVAQTCDSTATAGSPSTPRHVRNIAPPRARDADPSVQVSSTHPSADLP